MALEREHAAVSQGDTTARHRERMSARIALGAADVSA